MNKYLSGVERHFARDDLIVSKTDTKGRITYGNRLFIELAGFKEKELIGAPHSIIRHPDMPRCIFKVLWDRIESGKEVFAYVVNRSANGDHYWVFAHVTPSFGPGGEILGYHSNRRVPDRRVLEQIIQPLYADLKKIEENASDRKIGQEQSFQKLNQMLQQKGKSYEEFIFAL